jgi:type I restriction enzyme S subunit
VLQAEKSVAPAYFKYLLKSGPYIAALQASTDSLRDGKSISYEQFGAISLPYPMPEEQAAIAAFLDYETAKIDALIEKQQRLIELLKEKRQAVISHAVTKGLNPTAPMKDSGVEWLGEVPAHWDVLAIKHIVSTPITDGPHETPEFFDTGIPFVSAEAVSSGRIDFEKIRAHISDADNQRFSKKYSPKKFDIYMVKSGATTGVTAIVETDDAFNIWSPLAAIRCNELNHPYFVLNFMRSRNFADAIAISWSFGTQQNIGMKVIENLPITRPPLSEAIEIANSLQDKSAKFDKIILQAQAQIELMQERRTALISAAVTGKIDVRDWKAAA